MTSKINGIKNMAALQFAIFYVLNGNKMLTECSVFMLTERLGIGLSGMGFFAHRNFQITHAFEMPCVFFQRFPIMH